MGLMKTLNTMRMFGENIAPYERALGLNVSQPVDTVEQDDQQLLFTEEEADDAADQD